MFFVAAKGQRNYAEAMQMGDNEFKKREYKKAINLYFAAEAFESAKKDIVKEKVNKVFDSIVALRKKAEGALAAAKEQTNFAIEAKKEAERKNDTINIINKAFELNAFATNIVDKDPTLALRLAEEALKLKDLPLLEESAFKIYYENSFYKILATAKGGISFLALDPGGNEITTISDNGSEDGWDLKGNFIGGYEEYTNNIKKSYAYCAKTKMTVAVISPKDSVVALIDSTHFIVKSMNVRRGYINSVAFSPNGKTILIGSSDNIGCLLDLNGEIIQDFKGHTAAVNAVAFSPDGKKIITGSSDKSVRIWDLERNTCQLIDGLSSSVNAVAFSPDGQTILIGSSDNTACLLDLKGKTIQDFKGHAASVKAVAFLPDGKTIITASSDKTIRTWGIKSEILNANELFNVQSQDGIFTSLAFSSDFKTFITSHGWPELRWFGYAKPGLKIKIPRTVFPFPEGIINFIYNSSLFDINGETHLDFKRKDENSNDGDLSIAFSPDEKYVLTGSADSIARLWDLKGNVLQEFKGHRGKILSVAFSHDGKKILTGSTDQMAILWDRQGNILQNFKGHTGIVTTAIFSPDEKKIFTISTDSIAIIWDMKGNPINRLNALINTVSFSPDGKTILTGANDGIVKLWNAEGKWIQDFRVHTDKVNSLAFSSNGKTFLSGSDDGTVSFWGFDGRPVSKISVPKAACMVSFLPGEDSIIVVTGHLEKIKFIDVSAKLFRIPKYDNQLMAYKFSIPMPLKDFLKSDQIKPLTDEQKKLYGIK